MRCAKCNSFNEDGPKFCHNCGAGLLGKETKDSVSKAELLGKSVRLLFFQDDNKQINVIANPDKKIEDKHDKDGVIQMVKIVGEGAANDQVKKSYLNFIKQMKSMFGEPYYDDQLAKLDEATLKKEYLRLLERMWERWRIIKK